MGMLSIGAGVIGFWYRKINWIERLVLIGAGLAMIYPESLSDTIGLIVFAVMFVFQWMTKEKSSGSKVVTS